MIVPFTTEKPYNCLIHGKHEELGDGGTGCTCGQETQDKTVVYEEPEILVKNETEFCKKCGQSHKRNWCK